MRIFSYTIGKRDHRLLERHIREIDWLRIIVVRTCARRDTQMRRFLVRIMINELKNVAERKQRAQRFRATLTIEFFFLKVQKIV